MGLSRVVTSTLTSSSSSRHPMGTFAYTGGLLLCICWRAAGAVSCKVHCFACNHSKLILPPCIAFAFINELFFFC